MPCGGGKGTTSFLNQRNSFLHLHQGDMPTCQLPIQVPSFSWVYRMFLEICPICHSTRSEMLRRCQKQWLTLQNPDQDRLEVTAMPAVASRQISTWHNII